MWTSWSHWVSASPWAPSRAAISSATNASSDGPSSTQTIYVNEMLGAEFQNKLAGPTFSLATNKAVPKPEGLGADVKIHQIDWANVAAQRNDWIKRWDREMAN